MVKRFAVKLLVIWCTVIFFPSSHVQAGTLSGAVGLISCDHQGTWTMLQQISNNMIDTLTTLSALQNICQPNDIHQTDIPYTINASGVYCLVEDVTVGADQTGITVNASNVRINLKNHRIDGGGTATRGIAVNSGFSFIHIYDGHIDDMADAAIYINPTTYHVKCENITSFDSKHGIFSNNSRAGRFINCIVGNSHGASDVIGFESLTGTGNIFENCLVKDLGSSSITSVTTVAGFLLTGAEEESKIVNCNVRCLESVARGVIPYGILVETSTMLTNLRQSISLTDLGFFTGAPIPYNITEISWSPDGNYVAMCAQNEGTFPTSFFDMAVLKFDQNAGILTILPNARATNAPEPNIGGTFGQEPSCSWSPDGRYIMAAGYISAREGNNINVYYFDPITEVLTFVTGTGTQPDNYVLDAGAWSPVNDFIAIGGALDQPDRYNVHMFNFDRANNTLIDLGGIQLGATDGLRPQQVCWHPTGQYLASIGFSDASGGGVSPVSLFCLAVDQSTGALTNMAGCEQVTLGQEYGAWSPDGKYFATTQEIYAFDPVAQTLTFLTTYSYGASFTPGGNAAAWSPDGQYIIDDLISYFDPIAQQATWTGASAPGVGALSWNSWHPNGKYIIASGGSVELFSLQETPGQNMVLNNVVSNVISSTIVCGMGIQSSGNMPILNNKANNNDRNYMGVPLVHISGVNVEPNPFVNWSFPNFYERIYPGCPFLTTS